MAETWKNCTQRRVRTHGYTCTCMYLYTFACTYRYMHCIYYVYAHSMHSVLTHVYVRAMYKYSLCRIHQCMFGAAHALLYRFSPRVLHCSKECLSSIGTKKEEVAGSACVLLRVLACCTELSGQTSVPQCACCCCLRRWCALIATYCAPSHKLPKF